MGITKSSIWALALCAIAAAAQADGRAHCSDASRGLAAAEQQYWEWSLGAASAQVVGQKFFVPLPDGTPNGGDGSLANPIIYVGSTSFTASAQQTLVLPLSTWIGESYTPDSLTPADDPGQPPKDYFTAQQLRLTIDDHAVVDSAHGALTCNYFDAVYFPAPIVYAPPSYRYTNDQGIDVYAQAAMWVKGLAINLPPLPPGQHTIHLTVNSLDGYGYDNTWSVRIRRR